jgi:hypothetical protein
MLPPFLRVSPLAFSLVCKSLDGARVVSTDEILGGLRKGPLEGFFLRKYATAGDMMRAWADLGGSVASVSTGPRTVVCLGLQEGRAVLSIHDVEESDVVVRLSVSHTRTG